MAAPAGADLAALEDDMFDAEHRKTVAHRKTGLAGADNGDIGRVHGFLRSFKGWSGPRIGAGHTSRARLLADADRYRHAVAQNIEHGGAGPGLLDDLLQLLARRIAFDLEADRHVAIAVADFIRDAEDASEINVAFDE